MAQERYKVIICGEMGVGKSAIFERAKKASFSDFSQSTLSAAFASKLMECDRDSLELAQKQLI